jgi:hypothetical protein
MNRFFRVLLILIVLISSISTTARFLFYEYKFSNIENLYQSPIKSLQNVENFPSSSALTIISKSENARVFTFRQADLVSLDRRNWIDNFDPRAKKFFLAKNQSELYKLLLESQIRYILVPSYSWPTLYNTRFAELLANPGYSEPLIATVSTDPKVDRYQLFEIKKNLFSISCSEKLIGDVRLLRKAGGLSVRIFDGLLGIPSSFQGSLQEFDPSELNRLEYIGLNKSSILRIIEGEPNWYDKNPLKTDSSRLVIHATTESNSLVSLSVQGVSQRNVSRNLLEVGRLINVAESRSSNDSVLLTAQIKVTPDVGSLRIYLSSFSGPSEITEPVQLRICVVDDNFKSSPSISKDAFSPIVDQSFKVDLDLRKCNANGGCVGSILTYSSWKKFTSRARILVQAGYRLTLRVTSLNDGLAKKLQRIFMYSEQDLEPYFLRCSSGCPDSGIASLEWINGAGFRSSLILAPSVEIKNGDVEVFLPKNVTYSHPEITLRNYTGKSNRTVVYEFWRENAKR